MKCFCPSSSPPWRRRETLKCRGKNLCKLLIQKRPRCLLERKWYNAVFSVFSTSLMRPEGKIYIGFWPFWVTVLHTSMKQKGFLDAFSHLYKGVCLLVGPSIHYTPVELLRNELNLNKIASGLWNYAIIKTIQRRVRKQFARTHPMSDLCQTCF